jgi:endonuclease/exonuclease/phosphatase family protein
MTGRSRRGMWQQVIVGCCLIWVVTSLVGAGAASQLRGPASDPMRPSLRVLQLNLCNSDIADCYTGRSVAEAIKVIRADRPDIVTLNEVCRDDVSVIKTALSDTNGRGVIESAFQAARDRRTGGAFHCRNGQSYGIGVIARIPSPDLGYRTYGDVYPTQDLGDPEERVWLCLHAIADFYACTTHLASSSTTIAVAQCRYLLDIAVPTVRVEGGQDPMVLGADLNLRAVCSTDKHSGPPPRYRRADDGGTQHIVATTDLTVRSSKTISMHGTTDHPGLLVDLTITRCVAPPQVTSRYRQ